MSPRLCFSGKVAAGAIDPRAGARLLELIDRFETEHKLRAGDAAGGRAAAIEAATIAEFNAGAAADDIRSQVIAQAGVLKAFADYEATVKALRETPGDLGFGNKAPPGLGGEQSTLGFAARSLLGRDPYEIGTKHHNVTALAKYLRSEAHRAFAEAIEHLRPKGLGFKAETTRELDVLRGLHGRTDVQPMARAIAQAWEALQGRMADDYIAAGGRLAKRENWRLPNPSIDPAKARALGAERYGQLIREVVDREQMLDFATGERLSDTRFEQLLREHVDSVISGTDTPLPSGEFRGSRMLANDRDFQRFIVIKDAESWMRFAETVGEHASPFEAMMAHISGMADDTAMLRVMGKNPEATKRFILDLFDREAGRLARTAGTGDAKELAATAKKNQAAASRLARERRIFENEWAEVTGENKQPVSTALATAMGDARQWLSATQLGSAIISSFNDPVTLAMTAKFNGLPVGNVIARAVELMSTKGSEVFAAQQGVVMDTLAHAIGRADRMSGEVIRSGFASKLANANIRVSGLRRWTASGRAAFGLEMMAHAARERGKSFGDLDGAFRQALERYGIDAARWDALRQVTPHEPRPGAPFLRPADLLEAGDRDLAERWSRLVNTEMDYAVIEQDPLTRALILGQSRPGTIGGETRRSVAMYRNFTATFVMTHFARATARGWDGSRMGHAAIAFLALAATGAISMQAKEIVAGRDPLSLNPLKPDGSVDGNGLRAWGKAIIQGGGLGAFGDMLAVDQTKYGNTWAAMLAGPVASSAETILGDFVLKNIQTAGKGKESHFAGDALYALARHTPGSSLWFARLAFQREIIDQLALMADPRARERFARIEDQARRDWGQSYWWAPGRSEPRRAPDLGLMLGR